MKRSLAVASCVCAVLLAGCTVGPKYHRPAVNAPNQYYNAPPGPALPNSLGNEKWWTIFEDPVLQNLIRTAIRKSYDVRIAASQVLQAQAQVGLARANQFPSFSAGPGLMSESIPGFATLNIIELIGTFSYNFDFWGQYRRATEAARAALLSSEWNRREVIATAVSNVATAYFQIRALDLQLSIYEKTLADEREYLKLTQKLYDYGTDTLLDVRQAQQLVDSAAAAISQTDIQIKQQEDLLSTLLGENPQQIPRGWPLTSEPLPPAIPPGLPSALLERRPDILAAEQQLVSANAEIGVARAQFFPSLPLTGYGGAGSSALRKLFSGSSWTWNSNPTLTQPVFTGGRLKSNLKLVKAQQQQALLTYQQTIQQAFRQVSDALAAYQKYGEYRRQEASLAAAAGDAAHLSGVLYRAGAVSFLQVLTNETNYLSAQITLAQADLDERLSLVQLYIALGGGWEQ